VLSCVVGEQQQVRFLHVPWFGPSLSDLLKHRIPERKKESPCRRLLPRSAWTFISPEFQFHRQVHTYIQSARLCRDHITRFVDPVNELGSWPLKVWVNTNKPKSWTKTNLFRVSFTFNGLSHKHFFDDVTKFVREKKWVSWHNYRFFLRHVIKCLWNYKIIKKVGNFHIKIRI
jgi:hypothetical protein